MTDLRRCNRCGESKPLEDFYPVKRGGSALLARCKACENARVRSRPDTRRAKPRARVDAVRRPDGTIELVRRGAA